VSVCRDVPGLRTFSDSGRAEAAMGQDGLSSTGSPTQLLALPTWISKFITIFASYVGKRSKGIITVFFISAPSFRNRSVIVIKATRKSW